MSETLAALDQAVDAFLVYASLERGGRKKDGWKELGYSTTGRDSYIEAMRSLWEEIQETTLNAADYYLARAIGDPQFAEEHSRNAARLYSRYLAFFESFAAPGGREAVPDSAYFAGYEAAKGHGDALLGFTSRTPTQTVVQRAARHYLGALEIFPFDRQLWSSLTAALARDGRESEYLGLVSPIAELVTKSRHINSWIEKREPNSNEIENLRRALSDSNVVMHLGFAEATGLDELERGLAELKTRRRDVASQLEGLEAGASKDLAAVPAEEALGNEATTAIADMGNLLERLDRQISARTHVLPLYRAALENEELERELRTQRKHPVHTLLRRMYHENRS